MDDLGLNQWIKDNYGTDFAGRPRFRVSWTTRQLEKRGGEHNVFHGPIFIRRTNGVEEVPKYPFDKDRWVLEVLEVQPDTSELLERFSYEPLFVFKDKQGNFLPLNRKTIEMILYFYHNPSGNITSPEQMKAEDALAYKAEVESFLQVIGQDQRPFHKLDLVE